MARFDKAFLFVTFSFLTNFAPKNFITSKNVSMNKKLKSVLLVLLSMFSGMAFGTTEGIVFEHSFSNGIGDFSIEDNHNPDNPPAIWNVMSGGYIQASITSQVINSKMYGSSILVSPVIDLSGIYNAVLSFEYSYNNYMPDFNLQIREEGGEWENLQTQHVIEVKDAFIMSRNFFLARFANKRIQIGFSYWYHPKLEDILKLRNMQIVNVAGNGSQDPVTVNSISEFLALPEYTYATVNLNDALIVYNDGNYAALKDNTASILLVGSRYNLSYYDGVILNGTMTGLRTKDIALNEINDTKMNVSVTYPDMESHIEAVKIGNDKLDDYDCEFVSFSKVKDTSILWTIYDIYGYPKSLSNINNYIGINQGLLFHSPNNQKRIITTGFTVIADDNEEFVYDERLKLDNVQLKIDRSMKKDQWNTLVLPAEKSDILSISNETFAVFKYALFDGTLVFGTKGNITPGMPFLLKPKNDISCIWIDYKKIKTNIPSMVSSNYYNFVGCFEPTQPSDGTYYLSSGNTLKPLTSGGTIKGFRAYFEPSTPNVSLARAISIDGEVTAIENINFGDDILFGQPKKIYNLNGQYVGDNLDALPKGVYLVNGKKVTK